MRKNAKTRKTTRAVRRVGLYLRISKDRKNEMSTDVQENAGHAYCAQRPGWQVVGVYIDKGKSAFNGARRPDFERLMDDVDAGIVDTIVVYRLDRLTRSAAHFYDTILKRLEARSAEFVSINEGFDTTTAMGRAMRGVAVAFAQLESDIKSERISDWHEERTARGAAPTGPRPFGYKTTYADIVPAEAAEVRKAARRIVKGDALAAICRDLNERGVLTSRGGHWTNASLRGVLLNPHYANLRRLDDDTLVEGTWKAILTREDYDQVRSVLSDPQRRTNLGTNERKWLLPNMIRCTVCGAPMRLVSNQFGPRYGCKPRPGFAACGKVSIDAVRTDEYVRDAVTSSFASADLRAAYQQTDPEAVVRSLLEERDQLARDYGDDEISREEWDIARAGLEQRIQRAEQVAAEPRPVRIDLAHFEDEPLDVQRRFVQWTFAEITVRPATPGRVGFDTSRIKLTPRRSARSTKRQQPAARRRSGRSAARAAQ
jgi:DNA invertase Pin-like site-specific DNA recombinase